MGVDTALRVAIAVALVAVLVVGIGLLGGALSPAETAATSGVQFLHDVSSGVPSAGGGYGPLQVVQDVVVLIYPGTYAPDGSTLNAGADWSAPASGARVWLWALLAAIPTAFVTFLVARWLVRLLLGGA